MSHQFNSECENDGDILLHISSAVRPISQHNVDVSKCAVIIIPNYVYDERIFAHSWSFPYCLVNSAHLCGDVYVRYLDFVWFMYSLCSR